MGLGKLGGIASTIGMATGNPWLAGGGALLGAMGAGDVGGQEMRMRTGTTGRWKPQQEALGRQLTRAEDLYNQPYDPAFLNAMNRERQQFETGTALSQLGMGNVRGLIDPTGQIAQTAQGAYLDPNSEQYKAMYDLRTRPVVEKFQNVTAPGIDSRYAMAGRLGSGAFARARNTADQTLARQLSDVSTQMADTERNRQRQAQMDLANLSRQGIGMQGADTMRLGKIDPRLLQAQRLAEYQKFISGNMGGTASTPFYGANKASRRFNTLTQLGALGMDMYDRFGSTSSSTPSVFPSLGGYVDPSDSFQGY